MNALLLPCLLMYAASRIRHQQLGRSRRVVVELQRFRENGVQDGLARIGWLGSVRLWRHVLAVIGPVYIVS